MTDRYPTTRAPHPIHGLVSIATKVLLLGLLVLGLVWGIQKGYDLFLYLQKQMVVAEQQDEAKRIAAEAFAADSDRANELISIESFDPTGKGIVTATVESTNACVSFMREGAPLGFWFHMEDGSVIGTEYMRSYRTGGSYSSSRTVYPIVRICEIQQYPTSIMAKRPE